eukprot:3389292-Prymnesium_polylepis.1
MAVGLLSACSTAAAAKKLSAASTPRMARMLRSYPMSWVKKEGTMAGIRLMAAPRIAPARECNFSALRWLMVAHAVVHAIANPEPMAGSSRYANQRFSGNPILNRIIPLPKTPAHEIPAAHRRLAGPHFCLSVMNPHGMATTTIISSGIDMRYADSTSLKPHTSYRYFAPTNQKGTIAP